MHNFGHGGFFAGRNGFDALSGALLGGAVVLSVINRIFPFALFSAAGMALVIWAFFRMFSTKIALRQAENEKFLAFWYRLKNRRPAGGGKAGRTYDTTWVRSEPERKTTVGYEYFTCPGCGQKVRIPKGHGRVAITCPACKAGFFGES